LKALFSFSSISYESFEGLISKYIPDFKDGLNTWLNTTNYPEAFRIVK
jgi:hypothetical protein